MSTHVYSNGVMAGRDGGQSHARRVMAWSAIKDCGEPTEYETAVIDAGYCLDAPWWIPAGNWKGTEFGVAIECFDVRGLG